MHRITAKLGRIVATVTVAVCASLTVGATAAHADDPVKRTMVVTATTTGTNQAPCERAEVWGVAVGTPELGNYQVCWYLRSFVGSGVDFSDYGVEVGQQLYAEFQRLAPETTQADLVSYCVYRMPAGPNRTATITYRAKTYSAVVTDTYADGHRVVHPAVTGTYRVQPTVAWNPGCWT